ncbi:MAG: stage II sporulation protein M [Polyangiaceae bacterium]|nr:stage II sporulation protein M [Polyangiaceae bacterium]
MIPQDQFVAARHRDWDALDALVGTGGALHGKDGATISRTAALYRSLCNDLTRAEGARYTPDLLAYLHGLAARTHNVLYGAPPLRGANALRVLLVDFPVALRRNYKLFLLSCALFLIPFAVGVVGAMSSQDFAEGVLPKATLDQMADAYSQGFRDGRSSGQDTLMAGFYVQHNVGIAFRCFATGVLFGLGSIFFLVYNGLLIGTTMGWVAHMGHGTNILTFVCGHGPYEITAILIAGGAGLQMGYALVATDGLTRFGSLRRHARAIFAQIIGAAAMLIIAAMIEGFWSPSSLPNEVKWGFSAINMMAVLAFIVLGGRGATTTGLPEVRP